MKKSNFIALITYSLSTLVLALGMCMYTLPEWRLTSYGLPLSIAGLVMLALSWGLQRFKSGKGAPKIDVKLTAKLLYVILAALVFGGGFALISAGNLALGMALSLVGLLLLLGIVPVVFGLKQ